MPTSSQPVVSPSEADAALVTAHMAMSTLKQFVAQEEMLKLEQHRSNEAGRLRPDMPRPSLLRQTMFDGLMQWVRTTVGDAMSGFLMPMTTDTTAASDVAAVASSNTTTSPSSLAFLVQTLTEQLERERKVKHFTAATLHTFNGVLDGYRVENSALEAYKDRIVELQAVINHTKPYHEIDHEVGCPPARLVPSDCTPSEHQKQKEVANQLAAVTVNMRDALERCRAENVKLNADRLLLSAEHKLLLDRVRVLEAQLAVLNAGNAVCLRELSRTRAVNAQLATSVSTVAGAVRPSTRGLSGTAMSSASQSAIVTANGSISVGGVVIEQEVALWIRDVYVALLDNPNAADALEVIRGRRRDGQASTASGSAATSRNNTGPTKDARLASSQQSSAPPRGHSAGSATGIETPAGVRTSSARSFADHVSAVRGSSAASAASRASEATRSSEEHPPAEQ